MPSCIFSITCYNNNRQEGGTLQGWQTETKGGHKGKQKQALARDRKTFCVTLFSEHPMATKPSCKSNLFHLPFFSFWTTLPLYCGEIARASKKFFLKTY